MSEKVIVQPKDVMLEDKTKMYLNIENINVWPKRHKGVVSEDKYNMY